MSKRDDARKLKPAAQHLLRRQVVNAVRAGMKQVEAASLFNASLRAVNKWVALDKLGGLRALKAKRRGRRAGEGALKASRAHLPADTGQDARSVEVAVLPVDARGGGATD